MKHKKIDAVLISSLAKLESTDYTGSPETEEIYRRLVNGRKAFADIYELNVNAVSEISALDLEIKFYTEKLRKIVQSVSNATKNIHRAASESAEVSGIVADRHEDLTNTIITVSKESSNVYQKIDSSQQSLTEIRQLSENTITVSQKMQSDMNQLSEIIQHMNEVIGAIQNISSQTNLLSLNASIEAARSGEAGRGFAVVADEIRNLAEETKTLTNNMSQFVASVQHAAETSAASVDSAIVSLEEVNDKIKNVWTLNEENQSHIAEITDSISSLAAVSEEISSSMNEIQSSASDIENSCAVLKEDTGSLQQIGDDCSNAIKPIDNIEQRMDGILSQMGKMSRDSFYALSRQELTEYVDGAISAHRSWIEKLGNIINSHTIIPFQVDDTKCRFGHFYYSIVPPVPEIKALWDEIGLDHKKLHQLGAKVLSFMFDDNIRSANDTYKDAVAISEKLIAKLEKIKTMIPATQK